VIKILNKFGGLFWLMVANISLKNSIVLRNKYLNIENIVDSSSLLNTELPNHLTNAIILIEDKRFYTHMGVDIYSIFRAIKNNLLMGRREGASTITQQLVRTILEENEIKISRKIIEVLLSVMIDSKYSKKQLITSYCNLYQFENSIGIRELCVYENYNLNKLSFNEACQIAARFKYPILRKSNFKNYLKRVRIIEIKTKTNKMYNLLQEIELNNNSTSLHRFYGG
jgi:membrane peptidoglycan carboxypeptidase